MDKICKFEKDFLLNVIYDLKKLLLLKDTGYYVDVKYQTVRDGKAASGEIVQLSDIGSLLYFYYRLYNEPCPKAPTDIEWEKITEICIAMDKPEVVEKYKSYLTNELCQPCVGAK
jgi:hypothetical protein